MPRGEEKSVVPAEEHSKHDIVGIVLLAVGLLLFVALLSHDRSDLSATRVPPSAAPHNIIGPFGAWLAFGAFQVFGASAYLLPVFGLIAGAGCFIRRIAFLQRRWPWMLVVIASVAGILSVFNGDLAALARLREHMSAPDAGGFLGHILWRWILSNIGKAGATILLAAVYVISLLYLTNFRLGEWIRSLSERRAIDPKAPAEERDLERRRRDLERQAKELEKQAGKQKDKGPVKPQPKEDLAVPPSGLGADLQPVPEPTIRDLSQPVTKPVKPSTKKPVPEPEPTLEEGEVIPANEVRAAASTSDILGTAKTKSAAVEPMFADDDASKDMPPWDDKPVAAGAVALGGATASAVVPAALPKPRPLPRKPKPITVASTPTIGNYQLPTVEFLNQPDPAILPSEPKELLLSNARLMQQTLAQFDIEVALGDITRGPTITRYELHPAPGVKLEKISALSNNIAAALKAERINILAPVPGKSSVGIEVANAVKTKVIMRDLLESDEWNHSKARLPIALGKDVYGHPIIADLADMPHMLVAGSTGSGKSVCINAIIASLLYRFGPDQLRFVMIDPKVVELQQYNALPHLVVPVVTDPKKVVLALRWVVNEMEKRYQIFAKVGVRNIKSFNERPKNPPPKPVELELPLTSKKEKVEISSEGFAVELDEEIVVPRDEDIVIPEKLSYIVVIIDELADLMLVAPADVEMAIARITQMARAAGIHCIVATQRPSVDVITGVIKANIPARIAFQVASRVDSRTILDQMGADKLLGKGDMLYLPPGSAKLTRIQGVLITDQELQNVVDHIAKQGKPSYEVEIHKQLQKPVRDPDSSGGTSEEDEELIEKCIEVIRSEQKASTSLLQRRLKLGYGRAARIMDELEDRGIVGPSNGAEPRDILIDLDGEGHDGGGQHGV